MQNGTRKWVVEVLSSYVVLQGHSIIQFIVGQYLEKPRVYYGEWSPQGSPKAKTRGAAGPKGFGQGSFRGTPFTMIHPRLFNIFSFFCHPEPVKRDFLHCCQTQPAPRKYHTQYYVVEVHSLVGLNPNILVRHVEKMYSVPCTEYTSTL